MPFWFEKVDDPFESSVEEQASEHQKEENDERSHGCDNDHFSCNFCSVFYDEIAKKHRTHVKNK